MGQDGPDAEDAVAAPEPHPADAAYALPRPETPLAFTGERLTSDIDGQIAFEHFHRYCLARDLVVGRDVLDVAAGEGYGAALLAEVARSVVGVEIDQASVDHARTAYPRPNLRYLQGDALRMPLPDACVDAVVSFETLEHLAEHDAFLAEVRRVLRPGGLFLVSTPDREVYSAPGQPKNPYHLRELTRPEFGTLLGAHFAGHRILAQRAVIGSVLAADDAAAAWRTYDSRPEGTVEPRPGLAQAFYLLGLASDGALPPVGSSVFAHNISLDHALQAPAALRRETERHHHAEATLLETVAALRGTEADLRKTEAGLLETVAALRGTEAALRRDLDDQRRRAAELDAERRLQTERIGVLEADLADAHRQAADAAARFEVIRASTAWRLTWPLRAVGRSSPRLAFLARRILRVTYFTLSGRLPGKLRQWRERRAALAAPGIPAPQPPPDPAMRRALGLPPALEGVPAPASIRLPAAKAPVVTIIIPIYGQVDHTLRCLASIAATPPATPTEVLVVEDASGDPRVAELEGVQGLRLVRWPANLGFLRSCNAAAKAARGKKLFFLNNDTEVMPGAVDALVALLDARPDAGMVGARLLYPDGMQQEAGGIIWQDGSAWNYGHRDDPRKHEYGYVREADYISGAAIMLPRARWEEMGGFDEHFLPAYCEDSDLAFRLRAAGWKVLYQPRATIIHHEGVSHGTDTGSGIKAHQVTNSAKLHARWAATLAREALPPGQRILRARDRAVGRKVTLVIDHYVPEPDCDAGSRTMFAFMEALVASGRVVKFLPDNLHRTPGYADALEARGIEVVHWPWTESLRGWLDRNGGEVDEVFVSRPDIAARHVPLLRTATRAPIVFYGHDLHAARMRLVPGALEDPEQRAKIEAMEETERTAWRLCDVVLYPSEEEAAQVRAMEPEVEARGIQAYALPAPRLRTTPAPASGGMMFIGGFRHTPNVDAAIWLAQEILPLVRAERADATALIVGSNPTPEVLALAGPGVEVLGFVTDAELDTLYDRVRVAICPLRVGAGVKLKVVEGMHRGVPVVTTPVGAQGLPGLAEICDVAADAPALAAAVLRLMRDDALWMERTAAQARYVEAHFSPAAMGAALDSAFAAAATRRDGR